MIKKIAISSLMSASTLFSPLTFADMTDSMTVNPFGRVLADAAWYDEDIGPGKARLGDGTRLRAARIGVKGEICQSCKYKIEVDFADNSLELKDVNLTYRWSDKTKFIIGQFKSYFSLEELTSNRFITFMERGLPNVFAPSRRVGLGFTHHDRLLNGYHYTFSGSFSGQEAAEDSANEGNEGYNVSGRFTIAHEFSQDCVTHLGAALSYSTIDTNNIIRLRQRPESNVTNTRLVDTGTIIDVDDVFSIGGEAAIVLGPISIQGEYIWTHVDRSNLDDLSYDGMYLYGSYFLTGETRNYDRKKAVFTRITPRNDYGAVEVALRYSSVNLNDNPIMGGRERNLTAGLNWYVNSRIRVMGNIVKVNSKRQGIKNNPWIMQVRGQYDFG